MTIRKEIQPDGTVLVYETRERLASVIPAPKPEPGFIRKYGPRVAVSVVIALITGGLSA